jgi:hypothetical protein
MSVLRQCSLTDMPYARKEDHNRAARERYARDGGKHREYVAVNRRRRRIETRELLESFKSAPCADCGVCYPPCVMDFDHLADKEFLISSATKRGLSNARLLAEIAKCEVVCSNCHRLRSWSRLKAMSDPVEEGESGGVAGLEVRDN